MNKLIVAAVYKLIGMDLDREAATLNEIGGKQAARNVASKLLKGFFRVNVQLTRIQEPVIDAFLRRLYKKAEMDADLIEKLLVMRAKQTGVTIDAWNKFGYGLGFLIEEGNVNVETVKKLYSECIDSVAEATGSIFAESIAIQFDHKFPGMHEAAKAQHVAPGEIEFVN